nr:MAG TPA: DNA N-6-adenine-methyltransferase [Caudoviricetes sp.]
MSAGESYEEFIEKFKPKKTTDDCYTPPSVYEAIRDWACNEYGIDPGKIVRPFYTGGDYENFDYLQGAVVLDNPPFSILSKICTFYLNRGIPFFLFAPSLTAFSGSANITRINHIICDCCIEYENGAIVRTSFVTSYGGDIVAQTEPRLTKLVNDEVERLRRTKTAQLPKYTYPNNIVTSALLQRYSKYGVEFKIRKKDCAPIYSLDAQRSTGKTIFGGGLLLSDCAAAERAAAERAAATKWELSTRERAIVEYLNTHETDRP